MADALVVRPGDTLFLPVQPTEAAREDDFRRWLERVMPGVRVFLTVRTCATAPFVYRPDLRPSTPATVCTCPAPDPSATAEMTQGYVRVARMVDPACPLHGRGSGG